MAFNANHDAILTLDSDLRIVCTNKQALSFLQVDAEADLIGHSMGKLLDLASMNKFTDLCSRATEQPEKSGSLLTAIRRNGTELALHVRPIVYEAQDGHRFFVVFLHDMSEYEQFEAEFRDAIYTDRLTGLPNRETLSKRLDTALAPGSRAGRRHLFLEIGIDQMRAINTTFGMEEGNEVIRMVGARLCKYLEGCEIIARDSGDRFAALFEIPAGRSAEILARTIDTTLKHALADPFEFGGTRVSISATAGGVEIPLLASTPDLAIRFADVAYYEAKSKYRGDVYLLTPEDVARVQKTSAMVHRIRDALQMHEFFPVFQPKIDLRTGKCTAAECLIRWRTSSGEFIPPSVFIPVAESADLIEGIGRFIFLEACAALHEWKSDPVLSQLKLAVNISPKQIERSNFIDFVRNTLSIFDVPASTLEFEITETAIASNPKAIFAALHSLKALGVSISIDDFGTGHSSLGLLRHVPASRAKVDRVFLDGVPNDKTSNRLLRNIVNLMRDMDLSVTVEGIETQNVAEFVSTLRCDEGQGYFFAKPLEKDRFEAFAKESDAAEASVLASQFPALASVR
ncbi:MAG: EAL domain-containing protein [Alphaproteobacteria bacterium]